MTSQGQRQLVFFDAAAVIADANELRAAAFDINTGELLDGKLPARASGMVREWIGINRDALLDMWETQEFKKLDPLS